MCVCVRVSQLPIGCTAYGNLSVPRAAIGGLRGAENSVVSAGVSFAGKLWVTYELTHTLTPLPFIIYRKKKHSHTHNITKENHCSLLLPSSFTSLVLLPAPCGGAHAPDGAAAGDIVCKSDQWPVNSTQQVQHKPPGKSSSQKKKIREIFVILIQTLKCLFLI